MIPQNLLIVRFMDFFGESPNDSGIPIQIPKQHLTVYQLIKSVGTTTQMGYSITHLDGKLICLNSSGLSS